MVDTTGSSITSIYGLGIEFFISNDNGLYLMFGRLKYLWENGLLAYWSKQYTPNVDKCMVAKAELRKERTALTLLDLSSAFMLLGLGIGSSLLVFFLEMMTHLKRMQQFRHATNAIIVQNRWGGV